MQFHHIMVLAMNPEFSIEINLMDHAHNIIRDVINLFFGGHVELWPFPHFIDT